MGILVVHSFAAETGPLRYTEFFTYNLPHLFFVLRLLAIGGMGMIPCR